MGFYLRLAVSSIAKNRRLYLPYLFASALMVSMYYIMVLLTEADFVLAMRGGSDLKFLLELGSWVIGLFAALFLFYTNAFLIRRRKKEFGLYSVLGMDRGGIRKLYFLESLLVFLLTTLLGIFVGIAFSKLAELLLLMIIGGDVNYRFTVSASACKKTVGVFALIHLVLFFVSGIRLSRDSTVSLLKSENFGEKPPKANLLLGAFGVLLLFFAYFMAATIGHPVEALFTFFIAVLMVIAATYILFISGSVLLCRHLQKNKGFYYRPENFVTVSTMTYRMKRNGAGLASICILLTMVLVMIASSGCMVLGREAALKSRCPRNIGLTLKHEGCSEADGAFAAAVFEAAGKTDGENGVVEGSRLQYVEYCMTGIREDSKISPDISADITMNVSTLRKVTRVHLISLKDYNRLNNTQAKLGDGEVLLYDATKIISGDVLTIGDSTYTVTKRLESIFAAEQAVILSATQDLYVVTEDAFAEAVKLLSYTDEKGSPYVYLCCVDQFDTTVTGIDGQEAILERMRGELNETLNTLGEQERTTFYFNCYEVDKADFYSTFGGLFFIGIMLSTVFLVAAAMIIYYKQVSEGFEDQARFVILKKVGMTEEDIRANIRSQMKLVFFLPIGMAILHYCFAFPLIFKSLLLFGVKDLGLLILTSAVSILLCSLLYGLCYRVTSEAYYRIVR